jgi:hypothetical protein
MASGGANFERPGHRCAQETCERNVPGAVRCLAPSISGYYLRGHRTSGKATTEQYRTKLDMHNGRDEGSGEAESLTRALVVRAWTWLPQALARVLRTRYPTPAAL